MASKNDRFYFENLVSASEYSCQAADYLAKCLSDFNADNLKMMLTSMREYEHSGDKVKHEMSAALAKAFVTPVDREDLALISQNIDDVTDSIEEILQGFYMYGIKEITPEAIHFSHKIIECCKLMKELLIEFCNFKKPEKLKKIIIDLNHVEEECDVLFVENTMLLNSRFSDALSVISWREIYSRMENCVDTCEHVGDCIDMIVMKNS